MMLIILSLSDSVWSCLVVCVCIDWLKLAGSHHTTDHSCCMVSFTLYTVCTTSTSTCSISVCTGGPDGQMARWEHSGWTVSVIISHWHSSVNLGTQLDWRTICSLQVPPTATQMMVSTVSTSWCSSLMWPRPPGHRWWWWRWRWMSSPRIVSVWVTPVTNARAACVLVFNCKLIPPLMAPCVQHCWEFLVLVFFSTRATWQQ